MYTAKIIFFILSVILIVPAIIRIVYRIRANSDKFTEAVSSLAGVLGVVGIFFSLVALFLEFIINLLLGVIWGLIFLLIPYLVIGLLTTNLDVHTTGYTSANKPFHNIRKAHFRERADCGLGSLPNGLVVLYCIVVIVAHVIFSMVTYFTEHRAYILFWECWPFNVL